MLASIFTTYNNYIKNIANSHVRFIFRVTDMFALIRRTSALKSSPLTITQWFFCSTAIKRQNKLSSSYNGVAITSFFFSTWMQTKLIAPTHNFLNEWAKKTRVVLLSIDDTNPEHERNKNGFVTDASKPIVSLERFDKQVIARPSPPPAPCGKQVLAH